MIRPFPICGVAILSLFILSVSAQTSHSRSALALPAADKYIEGFFDTLRTIRPVPDSTLQHIRVAFYSSISPDRYADWNMALTNATRQFLPDSALFSRLDHRLFDMNARSLCLLDKRDLFYLRSMGDSAYAAVYPLLYRKNYTDVLLRYTYELADPGLCASLLLRNKGVYDSLVEAKLILDGTIPPSSQFALALKWRQRLRIRETLTDSLLGQAMYLLRMHDSAVRADPFASLDFGPYEAAIMKKFLTDSQYTVLLDIRNRPSAMASAEKDWLKLQQMNLILGVDKQTAIRELTDFYVLRYSAWNRLDNDKDQQMTEVRRLEENKPDILVSLDRAMWNAKQRDDRNNLRLRW